MPDYNYRGVDSSGAAVMGMITASNILELESKLSEDGCLLIEVIEDEKEKAADRSFAFSKSGVKPREMIEFFTQLKGLLKGGVTLITSLDSIRKQTSNLYLRSALEDIVSTIEGGKTLSDAIIAYPDIFSQNVVGMIKAGEYGGVLEDTFEELARYMEWQEKLMSDIKQATIYPITVTVALFGFIMVLFTFVVPSFISALSGMRVVMPLPTRLVMMVSDFFLVTWWIWLSAMIFMPMAIKFMRKRSANFAYKLDQMKLRILVFGELNKMFTVSKFAYNFSSLFKSGVPLLENLKLCESVVGNKVMEQALKKAGRDVAGGMKLSESLKKYEGFNSNVLMMIAVGEASGDLGGALGNIASYYNEEIPRRVKKIFAIVEPVILLVLIGVVGFTALSIILPIVSMYDSI